MKLSQRLLKLLFSSLLFASYGVPCAHAQDFGTINELQLQHFWSAVQRSNGPVTVLSFGDSVSDDYRSIQASLFARLQERFGARGTAFKCRSFKEAGGGTTLISWGPDWWTDYAKVPPGGYVAWHPEQCNNVGLFWVARPDGGLLQLSAVEGSTIVPLLTLDGQSPTPVGCYTNVSLSRAYRGLRADGLSGTNVMVGARFVDTTGTGIWTAFMTKDGQNLDSILRLSTNVLYPIIAAINPQLVVWHMKDGGEIGETTLSNRLYDLEAMWKACVTNGDVIYIGTPYQSSDRTQTFTPIQNRLIRQAAVRDNRAYIDCMTPCVSYDVMTQYRILDDTVHPSPLGNSFMANTIVWPQLGLGRLVSGKPLEQWPMPDLPVWITNSAGPNSVYGWAAWAPEGGAIVLKNPLGTSQSITVDARDLFHLSPGAPEMYDVRRCDRWSRAPIATLRAGEPATITLNANETVALEANPRIDLLSIETYSTNLVLRWPAGQSIEEASSPRGAWSAATNQTSPGLVYPTGAMRFYRAVSN